MKKVSKSSADQQHNPSPDVDPDLDIPEIPDELLRKAIRAGRGRYAGRIHHPPTAHVFDSETGRTQEIVIESPAKADPAA